MINIFRSCIVSLSILGPFFILGSVVFAQAIPDQYLLRYYAQQQQSVPNVPVAPGALSPGPLILSVIGGIALVWATWGALFLLSIFKKLKRFSRENLLAEAWTLTQTHWKLLAGLFFAQQLISIAPGVVGWFLASTLGLSNPILIIGINLIFGVIGFLVTLWILHTVLALYDGKTIARFEFSLTMQQIISFLTASFLVGLATLLGVILFIVPGIIAGVALSFFPLFILEKNMRPLQAIKASIALTKGARFELFLLFVLLFAINIVGASAALVGLFLTLPFSMFVWIGMYRALEKQLV